VSAPCGTIDALRESFDDPERFAWFWSNDSSMGATAAAEDGRLVLRLPVGGEAYAGRTALRSYPFGDGSQLSLRVVEPPRRRRRPHDAVAGPGRHAERVGGGRLRRPRPARQRVPSHAGRGRNDPDGQPEARELPRGLPYFAQAYGLDVVGSVVGVPGQDPSAGEVAALVDAIRASGARAVFTEAGFNPALAQSIATEAGVTVESGLYNDSLGDPPVDTYEGLIRWDVDKVVAALGGRG